MTLTYFAIPNAIDGKILHGRFWTPSKPKAVIALIHGLGEHCGRYAPMADGLAKAGIAMCALDLHGHGLTSGPRGLVNDYAFLEGDIDALLTKTRSAFPDLPVILMGHSMGGGLALKYTTDRTDLPIEGVIAQAPLIKPAKPLPSFLQGVIKLIHKVAPKFRVKSQFKGSDISTLAHEADLYEQDPLNHGYLGVGLGIDLFAAGEDIAARASAFSYDALVTHGTQDVLTSFDASKAFAQAAPNASFMAYENSAHEIHNDYFRDKVYADIIDWVQTRL